LLSRSASEHVEHRLLLVVEGTADDTFDGVFRHAELGHVAGQRQEHIVERRPSDADIVVAGDGF
jgi:hypothetical protein